MDLFTLLRTANEINIILSALNSSDINIANSNSQNLLHIAVANNKSAIGMELIHRNIDVNHQDKDGMTPLHYTAWCQSVELAKSILDYGGNPNIKDKHGNNVLWYGVFHAKGKHYELVDLLIKSGADPLSKNSHGKCPYDFALQINDKKLLALLSERTRQQ